MRWVRGGRGVGFVEGGAVFRRFGIRLEETITLEAVNVAQGEPVAVPVDQIETIHRVVGVRFIVD